jgi:hypothetical protein
MAFFEERAGRLMFINRLHVAFAVAPNHLQKTDNEQKVLWIVNLSTVNSLVSPLASGYLLGLGTEVDTKCRKDKVISKYPHHDFGPNSFPIQQHPINRTHRCRLRCTPIPITSGLIFHTAHAMFLKEKLRRTTAF